MGERADAVVIGGGLVGLATAHALAERGRHVVVCEKEDRWAAHQSGHNSGVVHSGVYYTPGGLKATLATRAAAELPDLCADWGVPYRRTGKLIVAVTESELPRLRALAERGRANGVDVRELTGAQATEYEPHVRCVAALHVASTGVCDFPALARALAGRLEAAGADLRLSTTVEAVVEQGSTVRVITDTGDLAAAHVINCGGLHSDRLLAPDVRRRIRIVPFRGEYWALRDDRRDLVRGLVYPVPDPDLPFLGVHLTRGIDDTVHIGPNAVFALSREGYRRRDISIRDVLDAVAYGGTWRMARRHAGTGIGEAVRSLMPRLAVRSVRRMLPEVTRHDLIPHPAGVRAQAVAADGRPSDDFVIRHQGRITHVVNAPSPAATACIPIGQQIAGTVTDHTPPA
ncbi:L-2-hydroxyglutarate oxidase [Propionibacteriaceae bacterium Y2011]